MRHSYSRALLGIAILLFIAHPALPQSVWQKIKDAAKQSQQQGQQGQPQQGQPQRRPGQPQPSQSQQNVSGPIKPPPGTKIEEAMLAPVQDRAKFEVSPRGLHVATVETEGSRAVVWYDGAEGPKFDEILGQDGNYSIAFSPDGSRYAYCARSGNAYVVMVDGKELVRSTESNGGYFNGASCHLGFTANNKHVFFTSQVTITNPSTMNFVRFVFDGKPEAPMANDNAQHVDFRSIAFSPDGDHYAYVWEDPRRQKPYALIIDGKPAPYQAGAPHWTSDSKHLFTKRAIPGSGFDLLLDGKQVARAFDFRIYTTPASDMVVMAVTGGTNFHPFSFLTVNGKKVPGSDTVERGSISEVVISRDGKHYAALCTDLSNHSYVITDGKRGQDYSNITQLGFLADSSAVIYQTLVNGKMFLVVGDREYGGVGVGGMAKHIVAAAGNRFAVALSPNNGVPALLLDGKMVSIDGRGLGAMEFSPDGEHFGYVAIDSGVSGHLVLDGTKLGRETVEEGVNMEHQVDRKFVFSPDSQHVAHFGLIDGPQGTARGVSVDGKFIPTSLEGRDLFLQFSPDSKHLFWLHQYGGHLRMFADGKALVDFDSPALQIPNWIDFRTDGTVSFLAQDDQSLKRISVTLPAGGGVESQRGTRAAAVQPNK